MRHLRIREIWDSFRNSGRLHNLLVFLIFVAIATVFWFMMAMNDSMQRDFNVKLEIENVPDSVTFISDPPTSVHVAVRDRGTSLLRVGGFQGPVVKLNFRDFSNGGLLRGSHSDILAALRATFGKSASILSVSVDSLRVPYTTSPGRTLPVETSAILTPFPGYVVAGKTRPEPARVTVFGPSSIVDTLTRVFTIPLKRSDLKESTQIPVDVKPIPGVRIVPSSVKLLVSVEPLVRRETALTIKALNVPADRTLMLFPQKVEVAYYVPMSRFNEEEPDMEVVVDFDDVARIGSSHLPVRFGHVAKSVIRPELLADSVEYSIIR